MSSLFSFLKSDYPELFAVCEIAEKLIYIDPSSTLSKARLFSEKTSTLICEFEKCATPIDKDYFFKDINRK
ncbi:hypothetical protein ACFPH8_00360 [Bizionia hallyeonensis]|uniref:Uncharacterized protein n=1 Tax=Bizionia hallyeonensis TaxID=1123757 RepID=A0ABW0C0L1_9FLAO